MTENKKMHVVDWWRILLNLLWQRMRARERGPNRAWTRWLQALSKKRVQNNAAAVDARYCTYVIAR